MTDAKYQKVMFSRWSYEKENVYDLIKEVYLKVKFQLKQLAPSKPSASFLRPPVNFRFEFQGYQLTMTEHGIVLIVLFSVK